MDERYIRALKSITEKLQFLENPDISGARATKDVRPVLDKIKLKAIQRIREDLYKKFHSLRRPRTNFQVNQRVLLRSAALYEFLYAHSNTRDPSLDAAGDARSHYVNTMTAVYLHTFKTYLTDMKKLHKESSMGRTDLMCTDHTQTGGFFSTRRTDEALIRFFCLNQRETVLEDYIIYHAAQIKGLRFPYERIFRSAHRLLMETATAEYDFLCDFFGGGWTAQQQQQQQQQGDSTSSPVTDAKDGSGSGSGSNPGVSAPGAPGANKQQDAGGMGGISRNKDRPPLSDTSERVVRNMFNAIFQSVFPFFTAQLATFLETCFDPIALLLMVRVVQQHNALMQRERLHCLDSFFDHLVTQLPP
jgi:hypothetical protein